MQDLIAKSNSTNHNRPVRSPYLYLPVHHGFIPDMYDQITLVRFGKADWRLSSNFHMCAYRFLFRKQTLYLVLIKAIIQ